MMQPLSRSLLKLTFAVLSLFPGFASGVAQAAGNGPRACAANELTLLFDGEGGNFDGMSHGGARVVLRNVGAAVCTVPQRPQLTLSGKDGKTLPVKMAVPVGMHPGPVMLPVGVPPEAEATGTMRWVSGNVYDGGACVDVAKASLQVGDGVVSAPLAATMCGPAGKITYEQQSLHRDAPYTPSGAVR